MNFFTLPVLPYDKKALEPFISEKTLDLHYDKHHMTYLNNLNKFLVNETNLQDKSLEEVIISSHQNQQTAIFNNAAQVWNHNFYWQSMQHEGGDQTLSEDLKSAITSNFGTWDNFKEEFKKAGLSLFGSGWVWLVAEDNKLVIKKTSNADLPIISNAQTPLITMDVWEHAYYVDYQNRRINYVEMFLEKLVNWQFAQKNLLKK